LKDQAATIKEAKALIVRTTQLPDEMVMEAESLVVIGKHGIGLDNVNVTLATSRGIMVVNTPEANTISVAEHALALMLTLTKRIVPANAALQRGDFLKHKGGLHGTTRILGLQGGDLSGKTVGLVGLGKIARLLAKLCSGMGMTVVGYDPWVKLQDVASVGVTAVYDSLMQLAGAVDVLSIHVPMNNDTRNCIDGAVLKSMKPTAILINCARGGVVDEQALAEAVKSKWIAGAGVDVFAVEPPNADCPLFGIEEIVLTPHAAGATREALQRMALTVAEEVRSVLRGEAPRYLVNPLARRTDSERR
jgi:D-3-phosphoglycerate dehydrogenase